VKRITNVNKTVRNHDGYYLAIEEKQNKTKQSNKQTKTTNKQNPTTTANKQTNKQKNA